jgi:hypothetical protein
MWSKSAIPGGTDPYIRGKIPAVLFYSVKHSEKIMYTVCFYSVGFEDQSEGDVAVLIYEWSDFDKIGVVDNSTGTVCIYVAFLFLTVQKANIHI